MANVKTVPECCKHLWSDRDDISRLIPGSELINTTEEVRGFVEWQEAFYKEISFDDANTISDLCVAY